MADYVSREVARDRLRGACKTGIIFSLLVLLGGLVYGGLAAVLGLQIKLPFDFMDTIVAFIVPTAADATQSMAECATKAVLLFLMGFIGMLMFRKMSKTGDAFRLGQLKQLKFIAFLILLLGFLPTVVANIVKVVLAVQAGGSPLEVLNFTVNRMSLLTGFLMYFAARALAAGARLGSQEEQMAGIDPVTTTPAPDYSDVPDLASMPTANADVNYDNTTFQP